MNRVNEDEPYDEWLMGLYLMYGEREFTRDDAGGVRGDQFVYLWRAEYPTRNHIRPTLSICKLTPKALDYLKTKAYNGSSINIDKE